MTYYAIGDVQGCYDELCLLLKKIAFDPDRDHLWFVGDLVNRGPNSLAVLELLYQMQDKITIVLGNHDFHLIAAYFGAQPLRPHDTLDPILQSPRCDTLCLWLMQQPLFHYDTRLQCALVHAGVPWMWDCDEALQHSEEVQHVLQNPLTAKEWLPKLYGNNPADWNDQHSHWDRLRYIVNAFTRMRFVDVYGALDFTSQYTLGQQQANSVPWFEFPNRRMVQTPLIFGHWAALDGKVEVENVYPLDTGCVWGERLTAMRIEDKKLFSVNSLQSPRSGK